MSKKLGEDMIKYTSTKQLSIEEFKTPFYYGLDKNNRWARLAQQIPWDEFAKIYAKAMCEDFGRPALDARVVIGAMIIKYKKGLSDEETIEEIRENAYLQYFIGYEEFSHKPPFDPSLFVTLRERLGLDAFDALNQAFISGVQKAEEAGKKKKDKDDTDSKNNPPKEPDRQGKLILDASVAPQDIKFPTDHDLLNDSREHTERIIDLLWQPGPGKRKPRTYRQIARKDYLNLAKCKKKSAKALRAGIRKQLGYTRRNIKTIKKLIDPRLGKPSPLNTSDQKTFLVVQEIYRQQKQMYDDQVHQVSDRIVSVAQPYVRPIVRGKAGKNTEFGAKCSVSLVSGFAFLDHLGWDAFNESLDLKDQVELYRERFGCYPEEVIADKIYGSRENREYLRKRKIVFSGKSLGRPPKLTDAEARLARKRQKEHDRFRNQIEGKFGEGKRKYDLDRVMARTMKTSESWIAAVFFVMNLARWLRMSSFLSLFRWLEFFKERWMYRSNFVFSY
jgi:IS5 family transposase